MPFQEQDQSNAWWSFWRRKRCLAPAWSKAVNLFWIFVLLFDENERDDLRNTFDGTLVCQNKYITNQYKTSKLHWEAKFTVKYTSKDNFEKEYTLSSSSSVLNEDNPWSLIPSATFPASAMKAASRHSMNFFWITSFDSSRLKMVNPVKFAHEIINCRMKEHTLSLFSTQAEQTFRCYKSI